MLDFDASLVTAYSEKEGATGNFKGGWRGTPQLYDAFRRLRALAAPA